MIPLICFWMLSKMNHAKILDIACGPGNVTKYFLSKKPHLQIYCIDIAPKMIDLARINNPRSKFAVMDCRHLSHISDMYNGVICAFGLPYINNKEAQRMIKESCSLLERNGVLYLSTMEGENTNSEYVESAKYKERTFVNYHEANYLKDTLTNCNMKILHEVRKPYQNSAGKEFVDLFLIATKT